MIELLLFAVIFVVLGLPFVVWALWMYELCKAIDQIEREQ